MRNRGPDPVAEPGGCTIAAAWAAAAMLGVGAVLIGLFVVVGPAPFGINALVGALAVVLALFLEILVTGAWLLARIPVALGMTARVLAGAAIATVGVVAALIAGWYSVGPPATGTATEAVILAVGPPAAGFAALVSAPRKGRSAAAAFLVLAFALSVIIPIAGRAL